MIPSRVARGDEGDAATNFSEVPMDISISLVDLNARLVAEWRDAFAGEPGVAVVHGSMLLQRPTRG